MKNNLLKILLSPILLFKNLSKFLFNLFTYKIRRSIIQNEEEFKVNLIRGVVKKYNYKFFVETGTYLGNTSAALSAVFDEIFTVELDYNLYLQSKKKLEKYKNIKCFNDDSENFLKKNVHSFNQKTIFFLDAHYSGPGTSNLKGETPCIKELQEISKSPIKDHIIIIDDISDFSVSANGQKLSEIISLIENISTNYKFYCDYDMLFALPNERIHREFFKDIIPNFVIR